MSIPTYTLNFTLDSASGLKKADTFGKSDPYCIVKVNGEKQCMSKVIKKTLDPVWGEDFTIKFNNIAQTTVTLELHDHDKVGTHDFLGKAELGGQEFQNFINSGTRKTTMSLKSKNGQKSEKGEVTFSFMSVDKVAQATPSKASPQSSPSGSRSKRSSPIRSRTPATARNTARSNAGNPSVSKRVQDVFEALDGVKNTMKANKKLARTVQKEQRAMQTDLDEFKRQTNHNLQDIIKAITDDIEYKDAFMRVQNKQLQSQVLTQSSDAQGMEQQLMQIDRRIQRLEKMLGEEEESEEEDD